MIAYGKDYDETGAVVHDPAADGGTDDGTTADALSVADDAAETGSVDDTAAPGVDGRSATDGAALLDDVEAFLARFVCYPSEHARVASVLWAAHAHLMTAWESTPRMAYISPEAESGKTRALEALEPLVPRPLHAVNATPAALFRKVSDQAGPPTILYDEIDTVFGPKAKDNEEVRGMLNAGHRRGATALRCVGPQQTPTEFPAYCAVALAGIGDLPDTIMSRSVIVRMRRRAPSESVEAWRGRIHEPQGHKVRARLAAWADAVRSEVASKWPEMPEGVNDRAADAWEPLLAVADAAGGEWPRRARVAAVALVTAAAERPATLGVRLLADLRLLFVLCDDEGVPVKPTTYNVEVMATATVIERLCALPESPWSDLRGKPIDPTRLARTLKPYGVGPKLIRIGSGEKDVARGYSREDLHDPWMRYLPSLDDAPRLVPDGVTGVTGATAAEQGAADRTPPAVEAVTAVTPAAGTGGHGPALLDQVVDAEPEPEPEVARQGSRRSPPPAARAQRQADPDGVPDWLQDVLGPFEVLATEAHK